MLLPDNIAETLFRLCREAESPETRKILRELAADIRAATIAERSAILRPMTGAALAHMN